MGRGDWSIRVLVDCTVPSHVPCTATNPADDIGSKITLLWAIVFAVANTTTILTDLILIVAKCAVECSQLPELVAFVVILTLWSRSGLLTVRKESRRCIYITYSFNHFVDHFDARGNLLVRVGDNKTMEILLCVFGVLVWSRFSFLHTALATDADFSTAVPFHLFQAISSGAHEKTKKVDFGKLFHRNINLVRRTLRPFLLLIFNGRTEARIVFEGTLDESDAFILQFFSVAYFAGVSSATVGVISWWWGR